MDEHRAEKSRADDPFVDYYVRESVSQRTIERFGGTMNAVLRVRKAQNLPTTGLDVADVGCNTGTQSLLWAESGHRVRGLDINEGLLAIARARTAKAGKDIAFSLGSATALPWESNCVDVCLLPELLEHVEDWQGCLDEGCRILRDGGTLFLSTTNALCPVQQEFDVPFYSWFPRPLKKRYERLSVTTRPELVKHAKFPAVHWFTPYQLRDHLRARGFETFDRFDAIDASGKGAAQRAVLRIVRAAPPLRWLGHVATPYTMLIANKR
jgi:ubiquinone/menaquinone biosynthesis C-methylase UbiE